jgi:methylenetetrahydrofolate dehydrogenase (NADP+)/methenyltetrahydrofolate cyclohydrolase
VSAALIDGKAVAAELLAEVQARAAVCTARGATPGLAVVLVGDDPASQVYVRSKERRAAEVGVVTRDHRLPASTDTRTLLALVDALNADASVDGILVQLPLPRQHDTAAVMRGDRSVEGRRRAPHRSTPGG